MKAHHLTPMLLAALALSVIPVYGTTWATSPSGVTTVCDGTPCNIKSGSKTLDIESRELLADTAGDIDFDHRSSRYIPTSGFLTHTIRSTATHVAIFPRRKSIFDLEAPDVDIPDAPVPVPGPDDPGAPIDLTPDTPRPEPDPNPGAPIDLTPDTPSPEPDPNPGAPIDLTPDTPRPEPDPNPGAPIDLTPDPPKPEEPESPDSEDRCVPAKRDSRRRKRCSNTGSGDTETGNGQDSEPPSNPPPAIDRRQVTNWMDVVEGNHMVNGVKQPAPPFRARERLYANIAASESTPDVPSIEKETFDSLYRRELPTQLEDSFSGIELGKDKFTDAFKRRGVEIDRIGSFIQTRSRGVGPRPGKIFLELTMTNDGKMINTNYANAAADTNPPPNKLSNSQITMTEFELHTTEKEKDMKNLVFWGRSGVENPATMRTIHTIYERDGSDKGKTKILRENAPPGSEEAKAFEALGRSDNVNGVYWALADHHNKLGNKKITEMEIFLDDDRANLLLHLG